MQRTVAEVVELVALELVHRHDLNEIELVLLNSGVSPELAARLVLLVPSAFAAAYFEPQGIEFPTHFFVGPQDNLRSLPYVHECGYEEAKSLARRWQSENRQSLVARVLDWSAEATGISEARAKGLTPSRMASAHHGEEW